MSLLFAGPSKPPPKKPAFLINSLKNQSTNSNRVGDGILPNPSQRFSNESKHHYPKKDSAAFSRKRNLEKNIENHRKKPKQFKTEERKNIEKKTAKCFNCLKHGHFTEDCRNALHCFLCEKDGHSLKSCPKIKAEEIEKPKKHQNSSFDSKSVTTKEEKEEENSALKPEGPPGDIGMPEERPDFHLCFLLNSDPHKREIARMNNSIVLDARFVPHHNLHALRLLLHRVTKGSRTCEAVYLGRERYAIILRPSLSREKFFQSELDPFKRAGFIPYPWSIANGATPTNFKYRVWLDLYDLPSHAWCITELATLTSSFGLLLDHGPLENLDNLDKLSILVATPDLFTIPKTLYSLAGGYIREIPFIITGKIERQLNFYLPAKTEPSPAYFAQLAPKPNHCSPEPVAKTATVPKSIESGPLIDQIKLKELWLQLPECEAKADLSKLLGLPQKINRPHSDKEANPPPQKIQHYVRQRTKSPLVPKKPWPKPLVWVRKDDSGSVGEEQHVATDVSNGQNIVSSTVSRDGDTRALENVSNASNATLSVASSISTGPSKDFNPAGTPSASNSKRRLRFVNETGPSPLSKAGTILLIYSPNGPQLLSPKKGTAEISPTNSGLGQNILPLNETNWLRIQNLIEPKISEIDDSGPQGLLDLSEIDFIPPAIERMKNKRAGPAMIQAINDLNNAQAIGAERDLYPSSSVPLPKVISNPIETFSATNTQSNKLGTRLRKSNRVRKTLYPPMKSKNNKPSPKINFNKLKNATKRDDIINQLKKEATFRVPLSLEYISELRKLLGFDSNLLNLTDIPSTSGTKGESYLNSSNPSVCAGSLEEEGEGISSGSEDQDPEDLEME